MIERLSFASDQRYNAIEAASHLNRYLLARRLCAGKRVLDVACGEGYGAYLMARYWGAAAVDAVDIAPEAVARARELFAHERVRFHCHPAEALDDLFPPGQFDLIVSLETIEHVADAAAFLAVLKRHLRPEGAVVISCPNDYWYYPSAEERNPFHVRKYTLEEFRALVEGVLGPARQMLLGTPLAGFVNVPAEASELSVGGGQDSPLALLSARAPPEALLLPRDEGVSWRNCSYFVGIWTAPDPAPPEGCAVLFPCSMTASTHASQAASIHNLREEVIHLRTKLYEAARQLRAQDPSGANHEAALHDLRAQLQATGERTAALEREKRHAELRLAALRAENEYMHEEAFRTRRHMEWLEGQSANAQRRVEELEAYIASQRQTIADQARLVDERDAYIRELEARVNEMSGQIALLRSSPLNRGVHFVRRLLRGSR
jgi:SAM-dependent methyltransferase/uncharacterized coiled-coil protein SlyX